MSTTRHLLCRVGVAAAVALVGGGNAHPGAAQTSLPPAGTVEGRVLWNEQPLKGAHVYATSEYNFNSTRYGDTTTDDHGHFSIPGVTAGKRYLYVVGPDRVFWVAGVTPFDMPVDRGTVAPDSYMCKGFEPVSPRQDESLATDRPELRWPPFPDGASYAVRVIRARENGNFAGFSRGDNRDPHITTTNIRVEPALPPAAYTWRVDAFNSRGHLIGCSYYPRRFTVVGSNTTVLPVTPTVQASSAGNQSSSAPSSPVPGVTQDALNRAAELFREARELIPSLSTPRSSPDNDDATVQLQARAWLELAIAQADRYPDLAVADARRAFELGRTLPGRIADVTTAGRQREALGWIAKATLEPEVIQLLVHLKRQSLALDLAREGTIDCDTLYDAIVRETPLERGLALADECRARDGTYPYIAIAFRARTAAEGTQALLEPVYRMIASEKEFKSRSLALTFVSTTWDLVPSAVVAGTLDDLLPRLSRQPSPPGGRSEWDLFGPEILELMTAVDVKRAEAMAVEYPDLEAARHIPGRTRANPLNGSGGLRPGTPTALSPPRPRTRLAPMTDSAFEAAVKQARALPPEDRVMRLVALGYLRSAPSPAIVTGAAASTPVPVVPAFDASMVPAFEVSVEAQDRGKEYQLQIRLVVPQPNQKVDGFDRITVYGFQMVENTRRSLPANTFRTLPGKWLPGEQVTFTVDLPKIWSDSAQGWDLRVCIGSAVGCFPSPNLLLGLKGLR
jgi:hypothetical protein